MALNDTQLVELRSELDTDPLGRGYAGMTDQAASDDLNTSYRDYSQDISIDYFEQLLRASRKWDDYTERASAPLGLDNSVAGEWRAHYKAIRELMQMFQSRTVAIDFRGHPNRVAKEGNGSLISGILTYGDELLSECVTEGSIGLSAADSARAECDIMVSRSWELFDQRVTAAEVDRARAL